MKRNVTTLTKLTKLVTGRATRLVRAFLAVGLLCMMVLGIVSASQVSWTSASAQGPEPRFGGVFRAAMTANPLTLDPYAGTQIATRKSDSTYLSRL